MIRKRFIGLAVFSFAFFGLVVTAIQARADNAIIDGLRQGANLAFGTNSTAESVVSPADPVSSGQYVALGDSVAAGLGLNSDADMCGRSAQAYPNTVAVKTGLPLASYACSGATSGDFVTKQRVDGPNVPAQLDGAYAGGVPALITITAGANDLQWQNYIYKCYYSDCGTRVDDQVLIGLIASVKAKLAYALSSINARSNGQPPQVILTGYYNPLSTNCANQQISSMEIAWLNKQFDELNAGIASVANSYAFASFAPVDFAGHDVCADDPWVQGLDAAAPLHPTAQGQQVIAQSVLNTIQSTR